jgi:glycosyltransferase involved in cell wall biosynthesis
VTVGVPIGGNHMRQVSVIIPTRNRSALLAQAIKSVLAVDRDGFEIEVIVVDDGSTDDTWSVVHAYPVVYLRTEGVGVSTARNVGIAAARGEFLAFIDDDDVWLPNNVGTQLRVFNEHPEYGAVIAQFQLTDAHLQPYGEPQPHPPLKSGWIFEYFLSSPAQLGAAVVRRSVVNEVGGLDPTLHVGEDWEWMLRIARRYPVGLVAQPVMLFRQRLSGSPGYADEVREWDNLRTALRTLRRHTQEGNLLRRLRLQRLVWKRRGWYASGFVSRARDYARHGYHARALRCVGYAVRASPLHTLVLLSGAHR